MLHPRGLVKRGKLLGIAVIALMSVALGQPPAARAQALDKLDNSLKLVPENAAFYSSMLRNKEQIEIVAKSKAWAKLMSIPAIQQGWEMAKGEWANPNGKMAPLVQWYSDPENQELVALLGDMGSQEMFIYGGEGWVPFTQLISQVFGTMRYGSLFSQATGVVVPPGAEMQQRARLILNALAENVDKIKTPELLIGFKLANPKAGVSQIDRLEKILNGLALFVPVLKDRVKKEKVGGTEMLTLVLDGSMVPWEQLPIKQFEEKEGQYDAVIKRLTEAKISIGLGVRDGYLLFSIGDSFDHVSKLGQGKHLLNRPEFKPLAKFAEQRLISLSYISKGMSAVIGTTKKDLDDMAEGLSSAIPSDAVPEEKRKQIKADLQDLAKDIKSLMGEPGASMSFSFLSNRGIEGYSYQGGDHKDVEASKPLTLFDHLGGSPILAVVGRNKYQPENYQMFVKWCKKAHGYVDELVVPKLDPQQKDIYDKVTKLVNPLLGRLDQATGKMLIPALADNQGALVIDGKISSKQWHKELPATEKPMPVPELAIVMSVTDAELLKKAAAEYRAVFNEFFAGLRDIVPDKESFPEIKIPEPQVEKAKSGTLYFIPLPNELGVDKQIVPTAGLSEKVCALALTKAHAERLLAATPLKVEGGPLADTKRSLAKAVYFSWPAMMDLAEPWVEFGIHASGVARMAPNLNPDDVVKQVKIGFEVLKVFRVYTSCSYLEDGALVTHSETVIKDLD
ncbi:MAG: hypothetical protein ACJ8FY_20210 [Gemmataceae bacterium]